MQKSILKNFPDADINVSIVWIQMPGFDDNEQTARRIAGSFEDPRVEHFYDPHPAHLAGKAFAKGQIRAGRGLAWDIYMFYSREDTWGDAPPSPVDYVHQLGGGRRADPDRFRTGQALIDELHDAMRRITSEQ